jgi:microcystin-dependent protein
MAGYWPQSRSQIHDQNGRPYIGAVAYFYAGGTTTPITVYRDSALAVPHPNPLSTDGNGSFPGVFFNDDPPSFYRVRVTTKGGVLLYDDDGIPVIGPSTGGGGPGPTPVDPDGVFKTGDMIFRYDSAFRAGFVRLNGRSIGSATSGAAERANSDTQPLFEYLWNIDPNIVITGGRGGSAAGDFAANKPLVLPSWRGRALVGFDTMGNIAANVLSAANTVGWIGGSQTHTLTAAQMPYHAHGVSDPGHGHTLNYDVPLRRPDADRGNTGSSSLFSIDEYNLNSPVNPSVTGITINPTGGGEAHNIVQPSGAGGIYMRL